MNMKNVDLRHVHTGLSDEDRQQAIIECRRLSAIEQLGERWIMHPKHAPVKGTYNPITGLRLA